MFTLEQAVVAAPSLAALQDRIRTSQRCLEHAKPHIPPSLRQHVMAGPLEDTQWCLLVGSASASTKLRQLLPTLLQALRHNGMPVESIRIKVQTVGR